MIDQADLIPHLFRTEFRKIVSVLCRHLGVEHLDLAEDIASETFLAAIAHRKDSVAFYFFPSYYHDELRDIAPSTYMLLKGKTCFHFKKTEQVHDKELKALLTAGIALWNKSGYMK